MSTINEEVRNAAAKGLDRMSPFFIPNSIVNLVGATHRDQIRPSTARPSPIVTACSSGDERDRRSVPRDPRRVSWTSPSPAVPKRPSTKSAFPDSRTMKALNTSNDAERRIDLLRQAAAAAS
ncbi:MAG: hypothetical protein MZU97_05105 [Bacillus subtilis]|nr:hypothetical protein [Bacillus subtilis]